MTNPQARQLSNLLRKITIGEQHLVTEQSKTLGVTEQQARTLGVINAHPGIIQRELADRFNRRGASISNMLKNLEHDGYVERRRSPQNDRNKQLFLTVKGKALVAAVNQIFDTTEAALIKDLTPAEVQTLITTLQKIHLPD